MPFPVGLTSLALMRPEFLVGNLVAFSSIWSWAIVRMLDVLILFRGMLIPDYVQGL